MADGWTDQKVLTFIELFKNRPELWDVSHPLSKSSVSKALAWRSISEALNIVVPELRRKMNSLLASYRRIRLKIIKRRKEGIPDEESAKSWFAFKSFSFLFDRYPGHVPECSLEGTQNDSEEKEIKTEELEEYDETVEERIDICPPLAAQPKILTVTSLAPKTISPNSSYFSLSTPPFLRPLKKQKVMNPEPTKDSSSTNLNESTPQKPKEDVFDHFGKYIASLLRTLPPHKAALLQQRMISEVLTSQIENYAEEPHGGNMKDPLA